MLVESPVDTKVTKDIKRCIFTYLERKYSNVETSEIMDLSSFLTLDLSQISYIVYSDIGIVKDGPVQG